MSIPGLKYFSEIPKLTYEISGIENLHKFGGVDEKVKIESPLISDYQFSNNDLYSYDTATGKYVDLNIDIDGNNVLWMTTQDVNINNLNAGLNRNIGISATVFNGISECILTKEYNYVLYNKSISLKSTNSIEYFVNENYRISHDADLNKRTTTLGYSSGESLINTEELMVIPGCGLTYPTGNFTKNVLPEQSDNVNYNEIVGMCYYLRKFCYSANDMRSTILGGTFIFDIGDINLSIDDIFSDDFKLELNLNSKWYNLLKYRTLCENSIGILSNIKKRDNKLYITFALPNDRAFSSNDALYLRIGFTKRFKDLMIKQIELI